MNDILANFALQGRNILILGASSGIGRQTAIHASALGANLIISGRNEERLAETYSLLYKGQHKIVRCDLNNIDEIDALCKIIDPIDGLVFSAGIVAPYPVKYITPQKIQEVFNVNFNALPLIISGLYKHKKILDNSSFVFISSFASKFPYALGSLYASSKAAMDVYAKVLAAEMGKKGLRVNTILPAFVRTEMYELTKQAMKQTSDDEAYVEKYETLYPRGVGEPSDIANTVTFLLSHASNWITGQNIVLDGGFLLGVTTKI